MTSSNKLLGNQQFGFRTLHSTAFAMSKCISNWWLNMDRGDMNLVVLILDICVHAKIIFILLS